MPVNLRLALRRARARVNFRLLRILLVLAYISLTGGFLIYNFSAAVTEVITIFIESRRKGEAEQKPQWMMIIVYSPRHQYSAILYFAQTRKKPSTNANAIDN